MRILRRLMLGLLVALPVGLVGVNTSDADVTFRTRGYYGGPYRSNYYRGYNYSPYRSYYRGYNYSPYRSYYRGYNYRPYGNYYYRGGGYNYRPYGGGVQYGNFGVYW